MKEFENTFKIDHTPIKISTSNCLKRGWYHPQSTSIWFWSCDRWCGSCYCNESHLEVKFLINYQPLHDIWCHCSESIKWNVRRWPNKLQCAVLIISLWKSGNNKTWTNNDQLTRATLLIKLGGLGFQNTLAPSAFMAFGLGTHSSECHPSSCQ